MDELDIDKLIGSAAKKANFSLSPEFADRLTRKVEKKMLWKENLGLFLTMTLSIFGLCLSAALLVWLLDWHYDSDWMGIIMSRKEIILYLMFFFTFSYFFDCVILPFLNTLRRE